MGSATLIDWGIWGIYLIFLTLLLWVYRTSRKDEAYRFFVRGFLIKVAGGVAFALIYIYYYGFGDTFLYHRGAVVLSETLMNNPSDYFRLLGSTSAALPPDLAEFSGRIVYSRGAEEWFMIKLLSPISTLAFNSYLVTTLFMSFISFLGSWKLFLVLRDILPKREDLAFLSAFLIPSVLFWGSGIMKDTFTLAGINYVIYCLYFTLFKRQFSLARYIGLTIVSYVVFGLKGYIILAFIPGFLVGFNRLVKDRVKSVVVKRLVGIVLLVGTALVVYIGPRFLSGTSSKYTLESLEWRVRGFHSWHSDIGGSTYNLGEIDYSPTGVIRKIPAALNVTFFRPYLWEVRSPVVLIAALESLAILILFVLVAWELRLKVFSYFRSEPILTTFLIYSLIFGFVVGFTSYNFGALARYKIPIFSLFVFVILYLNEQRKLVQAEKEEENQPSTTDS